MLPLQLQQKGVRCGVLRRRTRAIAQRYVTSANSEGDALN